MKGFSREAQVPALLEAYDIPFTGSDALTLALSHHKGFTKQVVERAGVPTPAFTLVHREADAAEIRLPYPLFVKPVAEGTGKGVSGKSRVNTPAELREQCRYVLETFRQPALVETYLPGREITVGVLGTGQDARVIGAMEIESLKGAEANAYSYFNKENCEKVIRYSTVTDAGVLAAAGKICLAAWNALGGRDMCRMDLRADVRDNWSFIEVNALPGLHPEHSDLPMIAARIGMAYVDLIGGIVTSARRRYGI
jgi:D-alanine-D-alanine ligase